MPCEKGKKVRSKAQWRLLWHLVGEGELSSRKVRKMIKRTWSSGKSYKELPEHVKKKSELYKNAIAWSIIKALVRAGWKVGKTVGKGALYIAPGGRPTLKLMRAAIGKPGAKFSLHDLMGSVFGMGMFTIPSLMELPGKMRLARRGFWLRAGLEAPPPF